MHVELTEAGKIRGEMRKRSNRGGDRLPHERYVESRLVFSGTDPINVHSPQQFIAANCRFDRSGIILSRQHCADDAVSSLRLIRTNSTCHRHYRP